MQERENKVKKNAIMQAIKCGHIQYLQIGCFY